MIAFLSGTVAFVDESGAVIDVHGVGYRVLLPSGSIASLPQTGKQVSVHTYLHVREDAMTLFGFSTIDERDVFEILIGVNGIGPKSALAILSAYSPDGLRKAVAAEDQDALTLIPGVGKKTAARMILELAEKLGAGSAGAMPVVSGAARIAVADARDALVALGYSVGEARDALESAAVADGNGLTTEEMVRSALKQLGSKR